MSLTVDDPASLDNLDSFNFSSRRSPTGLDIAPPRPAACANPDLSIFGYADSTVRIERATNRLFDLQADLRDARVKLQAIDADRADLTRRVQQGHKVTSGEAAAIDVQRNAVLAEIQVVEDALARAQNDVVAARQQMRDTLRRAAHDYLTLLRQGEEDAAAEAAKARAKAAAFGTWARDVSSALQHNLDTEDLLRILGLTAR